MAHPDYLRTYALERAVRGGLAGDAYWRLLTLVYLADWDHYGAVGRKWAYMRLYKADMPLYKAEAPPERRAAMNAEELAVFDGLPETVTLYRAAERKELYGLSWTLERSVAESLTKEYRSYGLDINVYTVQVPHDAIMVYYNRRFEAEVLVNLGVLSDFKVSVVASVDDFVK